MRSEITQHAHDAEFDANLLLKVMKKFLDNKSESDYDYILKNFVKLPNDLASSCTSDPDDWYQKAKEEA